MLTNPLYALKSATMASAYGLQTRPGTTVVDFLSTWSFANTGKDQRLKFDPNSGCAYAQPLFVPHRQLGLPLGDVTFQTPYIAYAFEMGGVSGRDGLTSAEWGMRMGTYGTYELLQGLESTPTPEMLGALGIESTSLVLAYKTGSPPVKVAWYPIFSGPEPTGIDLFTRWAANHFHAISFFGKTGMDTDPDFNQPFGPPFCQGFTAFIGGNLSIPATMDATATTLYGSGMPSKDPDAANPYGFAVPSIELYFQLGTDMSGELAPDVGGIQTLCLRLSHAKSLDLWWLPTLYTTGEGDDRITARTKFYGSEPDSTWVLVKSNVGASDMGAAVGMGANPIQQNPNAPTEMVPIAVTFFNGVLAIYVGSSTIPFILDFSGAAPSMNAGGEPLDAPTIPFPTGKNVISAIGVGAHAFQDLSFWIHPMKFLREATGTSPWGNMGADVPAESEIGYNLVGVPSQILGEDPSMFNYPVGRINGEGGTLPSYMASVMLDGGPDLVVHTFMPFHLGSVGVTPNAAIGQQLRYDLVINNDGVDNNGGWWCNDIWSDLTSLLSRVSIIMAGASIPATNADSTMHSYSIGGDGPKELNVSTDFSPEDMTLTTRMNCVLDNRHAQHAGASGNRALMLDLGYGFAIENAVRAPTSVASSLQSPLMPLYRVFTGIAHRYAYRRPDNATRDFVIDAYDRMVLFQTPIAAPLDMDGWNHYFAMRYLAEYAGVDRADILWNDLCVDDDPYAASVLDPDPYFLPFGNGMHPWTPVYRTQSVMQLMSQVRQATGFMLYFNPFSKLAYQPYRFIYGEGAYPAASATFTESPTGMNGARLSEYWNLEFSVDTETVRNVFVLVGIDSFGKCWSPIVVRREDTESIAGGTAFNVIGYTKPFVWLSSQFASLPYAINVADRMMAFSTVPNYSAAFECWLRPDLYPCDIINIMDTPSGAGGSVFGHSAPLPFTITGISHSASAAGGVHPRTRVRAQFLFGRGY